MNTEYDQLDCQTQACSTCTPDFFTKAAALVASMVHSYTHAIHFYVDMCIEVCEKSLQYMVLT